MTYCYSFDTKFDRVNNEANYFITIVNGDSSMVVENSTGFFLDIERSGKYYLEIESHGFHYKTQDMKAREIPTDSLFISHVITPDNDLLQIFQAVMIPIGNLFSIAKGKMFSAMSDLTTYSGSTAENIEQRMTTGGLWTKGPINKKGFFGVW